MGGARGRGRGGPAGRRDRASRPPAVGGARRRPPVLRRARVRHRRRPGRWSCPETTTTTCSSSGSSGAASTAPRRSSSSSGSRSSPGPLAQLLRGTGLERIELAYPGVWLREGVYATHGHFLDRHLTVPTFERLAVAAVERVLAGSRGRRDSAERLAAFEAGAASPDDYERAQAPVYAFLFALAQAGATSERLGRRPIPPPGSGRRWGAAMGERLACGAGCWARSLYRGRSASPTASGWDRSGPTSHRAR